MTVAIGLIKRGRRVRIVWDDTGFGPANLAQRVAQGSIRRVLKRIPGPIKQTRLGKVQPGREDWLSDEDLQRLVELNVVWRSRSESSGAQSTSQTAAIEQSLRRTSRHVWTLVQHSRPSMIFVAGGVYGSSGLFMQLRKVGIPVASFDSGPGLLLVCSDGIAAQMADLETAFQLLPEHEDWTVTEAQAELQRREMGAASVSYECDTSVYQVVSSTGQGEQVGILLPLNTSFDTAALGKHWVFKNQTHWMLETVSWSLKHTELPIVVRRHPCERVREYASADDYKGLLYRYFGTNPRIHYIAPDDPVNTYDLIHQACVVVPYMSTVGVEAAALGKPVVTEGDSYYADLGFVWSAKTLTEYFNLLSLGLGGKLVVSQEQREAAWRCYYLSQCSNFVYTPFTPMPDDFDKWVKMSTTQLFALPEVADVLYALDNQVPVAIVRHDRHKNQRAEELSKGVGR